MHIGGRVGVGVAVLGLVLGTTPVVDAAPTAERPGIATTVTLITGDQVVMRDDKVMRVRPGKGRERVTFSTFTAEGRVHVVPTDAQRLVASGQLDRRLFDLTTLVEFGYDDAHRDTVPLIVTHPDGQRAPRMAGARELPSINGVATAADKTGATWEALTDGATTRTTAASVSKVWLDGKRKSTLDRSAAQIGAPAAWEAGLTGEGVKVAVLDSGVDQTHPDLASREIAEHNFTDMSDTDVAGHGTHVASILAGTGGKYRGIAPGASILDGKVLDDYGWGLDSWIVSGMEWAAQQGADIVNLSLGGPDWAGVDPLEQAVESLTAEHGTLFVVAAGNSNPFFNTVASPGSAPSALTVGAVDRDDELADFSLTGPTADGAVKPDVTAPGVGIVAARHSAGTIGDPVEDGYTALSGTSMATPHVAGAAALLAQQHPDWTGQQIKAALTASATPTQGLTAFQQGAGRIDVARAMTQTVVTEPTNVSFGTVAWPHDDDEPVTRTLTYRNLGTTDVTLSLTVDNPVFSLSANQITVPAGGTASVDVTGDTKLGTVDGVYSATVSATTGDTVTRTPVVITREEEKYDLTLNYVDENGAPASEYRTTVAGLDDGSYAYPYDADGSVTVRLPKGRYVLEHYLLTAQSGHLNLIAQPQLVLDRDQTVDIGPALTKPVSVTPPSAGELLLADIGFVVENENLRFSSSVFIVSDLSDVTTAQLGDSPEGMTSRVNTYWDGDKDFALAWFSDRLPTGFTKTVGWHELATVHMELRPGAEGDLGAPFLFPEPASGAGSAAAVGRDVPLPATHTAYVNTENLRWSTAMWLISDFEPVAELRSAPRTYRPGRTYHERLNHPMFGPGLPTPTGGAFPWAYRSGDAMYVHVPLFTDHDGNAGFTSTESASTKLYIGDQLVAETPSVWHAYLPNLPATQQKYRLTMEAANPARFAPTASVSTEWTFDSAHETVRKPLHLNTVRFLPKLAGDGSAPAGKPFLIPTKMQDETGAFQKPKQLTVEVSYDEGKTWQRVPVTAQVAKLNHPADATSVSLRASAIDRHGHTVKQTVIRAYMLR